METSTPCPRKATDLRRRTLLKLVDTPIPEIVNDESERSSRRSFIEAQKKKNDSSELNTSLNQSVKFSGEEDIKEHLQICTKLHVENKITAKVAWRLHIIDVLKVISKKQGGDSLQVASSSLDIGAKVYGLRVDDVHAQGLKLAHSMARFANAPAEEEEHEASVDNGDEKGGKEPGPAKRKKKFRFNGPKTTIAKDPKSLLAPVPKLESVLFSSRIDSKKSTVQNLFTNRLPMDKAGYKFMHMSDEKAWPEGPDEGVQDLLGFREFDTTQLPKTGKICSAFKNFVLDKWDPNEEEQSQANKTAQSILDPLVYDDQGNLVAELDGPIPDVFNDHEDSNAGDEEEHREEFELQQMEHQIANVVDLHPEEGLSRSEYSYNSVITLGNGQIIDKIWAGPSHWKLKFIRRRKSRFTGQMDNQENQAKKKKTKIYEPQPVVFNFDEVDYVAILDNMKKIKPKKKTYSAKKVTLPLPDDSCKHMERDFYELMTKPGTYVLRKDPNPSISVEKEADVGVDTNNDFVEDNEGPEDNDVHHDVGCETVMNDNMMDEDMPERQQCFMGDNLVDAPEYVPKSYVPYALLAKKMDMRKLKAHIWQLLTKDSEQELVGPTAFSKVFQDLPSILPTTMKKELSCPLAFSALLHLANEHCLKLTRHAGNKDFGIVSDK